jgi:hypothetical protein
VSTVRLTDTVESIGRRGRTDVGPFFGACIELRGVTG